MLFRFSSLAEVVTFAISRGPNIALCKDNDEDMDRTRSTSGSQVADAGTLSTCETDISTL